MKIAIPVERRTGETRVAATAETVKKFVGLGFDVAVESGAGLKAAQTDAAYQAAGATIQSDTAALLGDADVVLKVQRPLGSGEGTVDEVAAMKRGAVLIGSLNPYAARDAVAVYGDRGLTAFSMELIPRITRAQSMDVLSSQANLAGYKAVLEGAAVFGRAFPMMMTAAGTVAPARVFIMGVGVAGLQAIATARRLGGVVSATDVRPATKEQVESLGGSFVAVEDEEFRQAETAGGYAKEMSDDYKKKQAALIADTVKKQDIIITTALVPGRQAPVLLTEDMVRTMKPGSVVVDMAVEQGGNCELSEPGRIVEKHGVSIVGIPNLPARLPVDCSLLYAKNLLNFVTPLVDPETGSLQIDWEDEIIKGCCLSRDGRVVHPNFTDA